MKKQTSEALPFRGEIFSGTTYESRDFNTLEEAQAWVESEAPGIIGQSVDGWTPNKWFPEMGSVAYSPEGEEIGAAGTTDMSNM